MEMESERKIGGGSNEAISRKLWKLVRVVLVMMKKGLAKSKHLDDVALLLKRSHKLAGKALHSLILSSSAASSNDAVRDYEFSCSNSPASPFLKRAKPSSMSLLKSTGRHSGPQLDEAHTMAAVQRVLEMISPDGDLTVDAESSPAVAVPGWTSRKLRITDSPFPVKENEEEAVKVNIAADDFINKFYSNLRMQKSLAVDSPDHDTWAS